MATRPEASGVHRHHTLRLVVVPTWLGLARFERRGDIGALGRILRRCGGDGESGGEIIVLRATV